MTRTIAGERELEWFERAQFKLRIGMKLDLEERLALARLLDTVFDGFDAREDLGITPKRGPRPRYSLKREAIAGHYWALRRAGDHKEDDVARLVAKDWQVSMSHVRAAARDHKDVVESQAKSAGWDEVLTWSQFWRAHGIPGK